MDILVQKNTRIHIVELIDAAKQCIKLTLHRLEDTLIIDALIRALKRGIIIKYICQKPLQYPPPFDHQKSISIYEMLIKEGMGITYLNASPYSVIHYKMLLIDEKIAHVHTFNYDNDNLENMRNFNIPIADHQQIRTLNLIFDNDFANFWQQNDALADTFIDANILLGPNLKIFKSPFGNITLSGLKTKIIELMNQAHESIWIYQQDISDADISHHLTTLALKKAITIRTLTTPKPFSNQDSDRNIFTYKRLNDTPTSEARFLSKKQKAIHAKAMIIDAETPKAFYCLGSCNFFNESFYSRELNIIGCDQKILSVLCDQFKKDWQWAHTNYEDAL